MAQNKIAISATQNFLGGGDSSKLLPAPDKARFALWQASPPLVNPSPFDWTQVGDQLVEGDSGVTGALLLPDASHGARIQLDSSGNQERNYKGQTFAWVGRGCNFKARCGFAFESATNCHTEDYIGFYNGNATFGAGFDFIGFHILQNVDGIPAQNYAAVIIINGAGVFGADTKVVVPILAYKTSPPEHNFQVKIQNGGQNILWLIDGIAVASYGPAQGAPVGFVAGLFYYHSSIDSTAGRMVSEAEYLYLDNVTI